jgi:hypothetical protein
MNCRPSQWIRAEEGQGWHANAKLKYIVHLWGKGEILRRLSGGFVCARPPFGSAELYVESHVLMNSFKLGSTAHFEDLKKYKIAYFVD